MLFLENKGVCQVVFLKNYYKENVFKINCVVLFCKKL